MNFKLRLLVKAEPIENILIQHDWISESKPGTLEKIVTQPIDLWAKEPQEEGGTAQKFVCEQEFESVRINDVNTHQKWTK